MGASTSHGQGHSNGGAAGSGGDHAHHIIPLSVYIQVITILFVLTGVTVLAARFDFGSLNTIIAFAIATVKAVLVLAFFMHLKYDDMMNRVIILTGAFFLIVMYLFCVLDIGTRVSQSSTL